MVDGAKENLEAIGKGQDYFEDKTFTADSNYHSPTNLEKCDKEHLDAYIPDKRFRTRDPRFGKGKGRRVYDQRAGIVEPVFANIRVQKRMDRFTLRGKIKVNIQWLLYCMVYNIEKFVNYGFA